jgi:hypothetical protein
MRMPRLDSAQSPIFVAAFVFLLAATQVGALGVQFVRGFRLMGHEPVRVPFSWDMFANRVERCILNWDPPLATQIGPFSSLRQLGTKLEWEVVYDHKEDYERIGQWVCHAGGENTRVHLRCFQLDGSQTNHELSCR